MTKPAPLRGPHRVGRRNAAAVSRAWRSHSRLSPAPRPPAPTSQSVGGASALRHRPHYAALTAAQASTRVCQSATTHASECGEVAEPRIVSLQIGRDTGGSQMGASSTQPLSGARLARDAASSEEWARPSAVIAQSSRQDSKQRGRRGERMLRWVDRGPSCVRLSMWAHARRVARSHVYCLGPRPPPPLETTAGSTALLPTSSGYARCYLFRELAVG